MSGRYERVNTQDNDNDNDEPDTPITPSSLRPQPIPNSPPPSFHSRASSFERRRQQNGNVDSTLADAFDTDGDDSDDEPDDRQRLVRGNSFPISSSNSTSPTSNAGNAGNDIPSAPSRGQSTQWSSTATNPQQAGSRVYGGGIQSDGVFSNMTARPERGEKIVEEQPPVRLQ